MKKKPAISLMRGNNPTPKTIARRSTCWRCSNELVKNDKAFEVPGPTKRTGNGLHYKPKKLYCINCMKENIRRTDKELQQLKDQLG